jgi:aconitate hydratase
MPDAVPVSPVPGCDAVRYDLPRLIEDAGVDFHALPYAARILWENVAHMVATGEAGHSALSAVAEWATTGTTGSDLPFRPNRVLLQDFSGVPVAQDLAALRTAAVRRGRPADSVRPVVPATLVVDHSVRVDVAGSPDALRLNTDREFRENGERYALLRWAEQAFPGFRVVPPGTGIIHQIHLERLAEVVSASPRQDGPPLARPDTVVGTDSHTPMAGALGLLAWGVGGIEATAALLGEPLFLHPRPVVRVRLMGGLSPGTTATDLALTLTERLRATPSVVGAFVEFHGPGVARLSLPDRATVANMAPEYGATTALFPVDEQTLEFLRDTGRTEAQVELVERYCRAQGLFRTDNPSTRHEGELTVDLATVRPCVAGPRRPDQRVELHAVPASLPLPTRRHAEPDGPRDGAVVIAALTSCTNTSHPASMITAGLVARRAMRAGLRVPPWVKTSLAPGSRAVPDYLRRAGVLPALEELGFGVVAFGCTTCHGMSGPLNPAAERAVREDDVLGVAVLSGNRNFEGRIHPQVRAAYLASPGLVVSYALAGSVRVDLTSEPLGRTPEGAEVFLRDLWPAPEEVAEVVRQAVTPDLHRPGSSTQDERWHALPVPGGELFDWSASSTYLLEPPYIDGLAGIGADLLGARPLLVLGDDVSTDHLSPVGAIAPDSEAGRYLVGAGVPEQEFNSFGARRGNHHVMVRGTFGSPRLRNALAAGREGPVTRYEPSGELMSVHAAAEAYRARGVPLVVVAGDRYGCGSARLGREGYPVAGRTGRARPRLRTHPPQQPGRHGGATRAASRRHRGRALGDRRQRAVRLSGPVAAAPSRRGDRADPPGGRIVVHLHRPGGGGHRAGGRVPTARRRARLPVPPLTPPRRAHGKDEMPQNLKPDFGLTAQDYGRHRAGFPPELVRRLNEGGIGTAGQRVLDLGTGTGSLARLFALAGAEVVGLDPAERLMDQARALDAEAGVRIDYRVGNAEETGLPDAAFDLVSAGQCWHWFDAPQAAAEVRRCLRPGGKVVIAHFDWLPLPGNVVAATEALITEFNPDWQLGGGTGIYPRWLTDLATAGFIGIETFSFDLDVPYPPEGWRGRIRASAGVGASLTPERVAEFDRRLEAVLRQDFPGEVLRLPHRTWAVTATSPS